MNRRNVVGALVGDIAGSVYEFNNYRSKDFELFAPWHGRKCFATDDSIMTLAICEALMRSRESGYDNLSRQAVECMQQIGRPYPDCGYGGRFLKWMYEDDPLPYNSYGNGSAMRVSPCAWVDPSVGRALAKTSAEVTHNHPEGIKGAMATADAIFICREFGGELSPSELKQRVREHIETEYGYDLSKTLDEIRPTYRFNETCQDTVPQAIAAFLESTDFEDAIRNGISLGGDSDTLAAITGSIAEAAYGIPEWIRDKAKSFLDAPLKDVLERWESFLRGE